MGQASRMNVAMKKHVDRSLLPAKRPRSSDRALTYFDHEDGHWRVRRGCVVEPDRFESKREAQIHAKRLRKLDPKTETNTS
jgi:hypothetical protein